MAFSAPSVDKPGRSLVGAVSVPTEDTLDIAKYKAKKPKQMVSYNHHWQSENNNKQLRNTVEWC